MSYRIYTVQNLADTSRDPDQIITKELGHSDNFDNCKIVVDKYIADHFFHKDTVLKERKEGYYCATDFTSYGVKIIVEKINIS